jgi:anti-anti-sigma factor
MTKFDAAFSTSITHTDRWIVALSGEIDAAARAELLSLVATLATRRGDIDFDLSGVRFIDTAGWACVRAASNAATTSGKSARIVNPSPTVRHLTDVMARSHTRAPLSSAA